MFFGVLVVALFVSTTSAAHAGLLQGHPHLRCSACRALGEVIGKRMNESVQKFGKTSIQASHRLGVTGTGVKRIDYESSELRAIEIMEGICQYVGDQYKLRITSDGDREFSANVTLEKAHYYGAQDKEQLTGSKAQLRSVCFEITDEHDEDIVQLIKHERVLDALQHKLCYEVFRVCGTKAHSVALEKEKLLREKWLERKRIREQKEQEEALAAQNVTNATEENNGNIDTNSTTEQTPQDSTKEPVVVTADEKSKEENTMPNDEM